MSKSTELIQKLVDDGTFYADLDEGAKTLSHLDFFHDVKLLVLPFVPLKHRVLCEGHIDNAMHTTYRAICVAIQSDREDSIVFNAMVCILSTHRKNIINHALNAGVSDENIVSLITKHFGEQS